MSSRSICFEFEGDLLDVGVGNAELDPEGGVAHVVGHAIAVGVHGEVFGVGFGELGGEEATEGVDAVGDEAGVVADAGADVGVFLVPDAKTMAIDALGVGVGVGVGEAGEDDARFKGGFAATIEGRDQRGASVLGTYSLKGSRRRMPTWVSRNSQTA